MSSTLRDAVCPSRRAVTDPLVQRALAGDPRAERALFDAHVDRVYGLARAMTRDPESARDVTSGRSSAPVHEASDRFARRSAACTAGPVFPAATPQGRKGHR